MTDDSKFLSLLPTVQPDGAHPYSEPSLVQLLVLLSFFYLLNVVRTGADHFLHAGIVAMICFGMIYGTPLAGILSPDWEGTFTSMGYLGLVAIIFEGGLSTNLSLLLANLPLSLLCAAVGVILPIALSFALLSGAYGYPPLEAFAAGAALSSTSLGTTLMALSSVSRTAMNSTPPSTGCLTSHAMSENNEPMSSSNIDTLPKEGNLAVMSVSQPAPVSLQQTRIGTVLVSAAVIDDVIGLVLAAMIPALSTLNSDQPHSNLPWAVIHPLLSSILMAIMTPLVARYVLRPMFWFGGIGERWCAPARPGKPWGTRWLFGLSSENLKVKGWGTQGHADAAKLLLMVIFVSAFSAIAYYTGSSILFGAYLAGCVLPYMSRPISCPEEDFDARFGALSFEESFARSAGSTQQFILAPLFFASIGYAIPFVSLWEPTVLWRGMLYSLFMALGKMAVGLPIIVYTIISQTDRFGRMHKWKISRVYDKAVGLTRGRKGQGGHGTMDHNGVELTSLERPTARSPVAPTNGRPLTQKLKSSLAPALFIGSAMIARGEIGLLIAQIAKNGGDAHSGGAGEGLLGEEAFLVCIWAILLCTLIGPVSVGFIIKWWAPLVTSGIWQ